MHWVGDGFPVHSLFSYSDHGRELSPFLLLDYARPTEFTPSPRPRGVGVHPHRGFETVTIVYHGEVAHRDSTGRGGIIGPGDVQWMTAGTGILHEEFHSEAFTRSGGLMQMAQLWVNLPRSAKGTPAGYQAITAAQIPALTLPDGAGTARVIAGEFLGVTGPAHTHSPLLVADVRLAAGARVRLPKPAGWSGGLVVLDGVVAADDQAPVGAAQLLIAPRQSTGHWVASDAGALLLLLQGQPLDEPVVGYGPFVMNTRAEITQAIDDFNNGRFGTM